MPLTFNAAEFFVVTINEKPWTCAMEALRALEYNKKTLKTVTMIKAHVSSEKLRSYVAIDQGVCCKHLNQLAKRFSKYDIYINEDGMIELLVGSQKKPAKVLSEYMGIKIIGHKYVRKEASTIHTIQKVFEGISVKRHLCIGSYRIDLYFSEHKLAIECDEHDHKDRDINYEIYRQMFIKDQLTCKFIRYNPDAKDFTIESVLNKSFQYISKKHSA